MHRNALQKIAHTAMPRLWLAWIGEMRVLRDVCRLTDYEFLRLGQHWIDPGSQQQSGVMFYPACPVTRTCNLRLVSVTPERVVG